MGKGKKKGKKAAAKVAKLPKKKCCESRDRCNRCPLRMLKEGTLPSGYTVHKRKLVTVGRATKKYTRAGKQTLDVKLNAAGLKALKKQKKLALKIAITTTATGHASTTVDRSFTLRR